MSNNNLFEGGNIWPETESYEQTVAMIDGIIAATKNYIKETGLEVYVIGSSATPTQNVYFKDELIGIYKEREQKFISLDKYQSKFPPGELPKGAKIVPKKSGDLDVMIDGDEAMAYFKTKDGKSTRQALDDLLTKKGVKTKKAGVTVHARIPFEKQLYQVDIKVVSKAGKVSKFHHHDIPAGSPYKGVNKQMMMNVLATSQGMLWSPDEGLYMRDANGKKSTFISDDLEVIAKKLLGPTANASSLGSVESIMNAIPDEAKKNEILQQAKSSASWQAATPDVGTNEWFSKIRNMLK